VLEKLASLLNEVRIGGGRKQLKLGHRNLTECGKLSVFKPKREAARAVLTAFRNSKGIGITVLL
jgi:hypothetical protein